MCPTNIRRCAADLCEILTFCRPEQLLEHPHGKLTNITDSSEDTDFAADDPASDYTTSDDRISEAFFVNSTKLHSLKYVGQDWRIALSMPQISIMGNSNFLPIKTLILSQYTVDCGALLETIQNLAPTLECLRFSFITLSSGSWSTIFEAMATDLSLKTVYFCGLSEAYHAHGLLPVPFSAIDRA